LEKKGASLRGLFAEEEGKKERVSHGQLTISVGVRVEEKNDDQKGKRPQGEEMELFRERKKKGGNLGGKKNGRGCRKSQGDNRRGGRVYP